MCACMCSHTCMCTCLCSPACMCACLCSKTRISAQICAFMCSQTSMCSNICKKIIPNYDNIKKKYILKTFFFKCPTTPNKITPWTSFSLAWDKLYSQSGVASRKSAPPRLTGLWPVFFFYCILPAPWWEGLREVIQKKIRLVMEFFRKGSAPPPIFGSFGTHDAHLIFGHQKGENKISPKHQKWPYLK